MLYSCAFENPRVEGLSVNEVLIGIAASPGKVKGKVLIKTDEKVPLLTVKSVLVVVRLEPQIALDIGGHVGAVISETGSLTCHGATILREMGTPCVVGVKEATSILRDGMFVIVDGTIGQVELVK